VFVVVDGLAKLRLIELGRQNAHEAQILKGLEPGDVLVTHPGDDVVDGVAVRLR
jgi:HlyD family secretion protein